MNNRRKRFSIHKVHFVFPALLILAVVAVAAHHFINVGIIFAVGGNAGTGGGAAIRPGCTWELAVSHCTEATWRYYRVGESNANGNIKGTTDGAIIAGTVDPTAPGGVVSGCADAGGYWRYALVSNKDWVNDAVPGVPFSQGEQVGIGAIGGAGEHSNKFGGREQYSANPRSGGGGNDWEYVHQQFEESKAKGYLVTGIQWNAASSLGWFCAEPPEGTSTTTTHGFNCASDYGMYTNNYGRTYAEAGVANLSALYGDRNAATDVNTGSAGGTGIYRSEHKVTEWGSDAQHGPGDSVTKVYARPGDSVQFQHTICWGNQAVTGNWDFEYGTARDEQLTVKAWQYNNKRNTFQITAVPGNHAFDGASGSSSFINTGWYTIREATPTFNSSNVGSGRNITGSSFSGGKWYNPNEVETSAYGVRISSPHRDTYDTANPRYSCQTAVFASNKYVLPGYQVPGFAEALDCNTQAITFSDVGGQATSAAGHYVSFAQTLEANVVKSWVARKTEITGTCSCSQEMTGCIDCTEGSWSANETGSRNRIPPYTNIVLFKEKPESAWQSRKAYVYPASKEIYTHVPKWTTTDMDHWWLPESSTGGGKGDDTNRPHNAHFEDFDQALNSPGSWGDNRYNGGCKYTTCTKSCGGSKTITTGSYPIKDAYGNVTGTGYYHLTVHCARNVQVTSITDPVDDGYYDQVRNFRLKRTQASNLTGAKGYPYRSKNYGDVKKTAEVYVPYNYTTSVSTAIPTSPLYVGEKVQLSANVTFNPRSNSHVSTKSYATISKPTKIKFVQFAVPEGTDFSSIKGVDAINGKNDSTQDPCAYYSSLRQSGTDCIIVDNDLMNNHTYNAGGSYSGKREVFGTYTRTVPDLANFPAGTKYCVAVGVFPSDSYDDPNNNSISYGQTEGIGMSHSGSLWNVSGLTCRTVAKKPNFQIWGAGAYTGNAIKTSISKKDVGANFGKENFNPTGVFGSWSEYTAIAGKEITRFASGATLGYKRYNLSAGDGGYQGSISTSSDAPSHCKDLSIMSVAHDSCGTSVGNSGISVSSSILLNRIEARYNSNKSFNNVSSINSTSNYRRMNDDGTSFFYASIPGNGSMGNVTFTPSTNYTANNTYVTYVSGDLNITGNICYGSGSGCNSTVKTIKAQDTGGASYDSAAALPQSLIIVDGNITIDENVTRVDSWLIARNGTINTCKGYKVGQLVEENAHGDAEYHTGSGYLNSRVCMDTLIINGPVFAKKLELVRTAGAWSGGGSSYSGDVRNRDYTNPTSNGSVAPAEIFNLRPDAYLWAYNQAQRYSEAVVTYTREIPPRY